MKRRVLFALVSVVVVFVAFLITRYFDGNKVVTYRQVFDLTFEGLNDGRFPNGTPFLVSDIINPQVVERVYRENNLAGQGVSLADFHHAVNIEPYAPDYFAILQRYRERLNNRDLEVSEIAALESRMRNELNAATGSSVMLSLQFPAETLAQGQAEKLLTNITQVWAQRAIEDKGVLKLNLPLYTARIFNEERFRNLDYPVGIELLLKNIDLLQQNISSLKKEPNATSVVDDETGYSLEDLQKAIQDVADYDLRRLADPIKELGLARNPDFVKLFYSSRLQELWLQKYVWEQRAEVTRQVLGSYSGTTGHGRDGSIAATAMANTMTPNALTPLLGDAFLDRLLDLSHQDEDLVYRQELTRQILDYENEVLDVKHAIAEIQITLNTLDHKPQNNSDYAREIEAQLPRLLSTLRGYAEVVDRLYETLSRQAVGTVSELIQPQRGSFQKIAAQPVTGTDIKTLAALLVLILFGTVFISLIVDSLRTSVGEEP